MKRSSGAHYAALEVRAPRLAALRRALRCAPKLAAWRHVLRWKSPGAQSSGLATRTALQVPGRPRASASCLDLRACLLIQSRRVPTRPTARGRLRGRIASRRSSETTRSWTMSVLFPTKILGRARAGAVRPRVRLGERSYGRGCEHRTSTCSRQRCRFVPRASEMSDEDVSRLIVRGGDAFFCARPSTHSPLRALQVLRPTAGLVGPNTRHAHLPGAPTLYGGTSSWFRMDSSMFRHSATPAAGELGRQGESPS